MLAITWSHLAFTVGIIPLLGGQIGGIFPLIEVNKPSFRVTKTTCMNTFWMWRQPSCEQQLQGVKVKRDYNPGTKTNASSQPTMISRVAATSSSFYLDEGPPPRGQMCSI